MGASASVIQEYYKAVDYWADIAGKKDWKLAIWIVGRNDVDLVDKFLEIERSPVGQFDDIFFRFDTPYRGDDDEYAAQLWQEYAGWFEEQAEEKDDMLKALRHDGLLKTEYRPDTSAEPTAANLWKEMLRFKECISRLENAFFCIYFPPEQSGEFPRTEWFGQVLKEGVPQGIRLTTIDLKKNRSVALDESPEVVHIRPRFDMAAALHNRMARADTGNDLIAPENRFKQQVTAVMDCTRKQDLKLLEKEIRKLLDIAGELKDANIRISALFIASEACYAIREYKSSMKYSDKTIREAEKAMKDGEAAGYSYWKMAVSMKAAILTAEKKTRRGGGFIRGDSRESCRTEGPLLCHGGLPDVRLPAVRGGKAGTGVRIFPAGIGGRKLSFRRHQTGFHLHLRGTPGAPYGQAGACAD